MKTKKSLAAAAVAALVLSLSAACGSSEDVANDDPTTSATTPTVTVTAPTTPPTTTPPSTEPSTPADDGDRLSGAGFSFAIPQEWEDITASLKAQNPQLDVAVGEKDATTFRTNFNVVIASATTATIEGDTAALRKEAASELKTITKTTVSPLADREIDGESALGQTSTFTSSGTSVTFLQYFTIHDGKAYPVTMTFATSNRDKASDVLAGILDSWQWA